jgi:hypothetical protein
MRMSCTPAEHLCGRFVGTGAVADPRVHLVTFYTEGRPHDTGMDLRAAQAQFREAVGRHFVSYRAWSHREVKAVAPHVVRVFKSLPLQLNPGYNHIGYGAYKPWLLLEALSRALPGEIVMMHDVNIQKYPVYALHGREYAGMARFVMGSLGADVYMPMDEPPRNFIAGYTKAQVVRELGAGYFVPNGTVDEGPWMRWRRRIAPERHPQILREWAAAQLPASKAQARTMAAIFAYPQLNAHLVIARNTAPARALLREWLDACGHDEWMAPRPDLAPHPCFRWHTPDQGVFSVIAAKHVLAGTLPSDYPRFFFNGEGGRAFTCDRELHVCNSTLAQMRAGMARPERYPPNLEFWAVRRPRG